MRLSLLLLLLLLHHYHTCDSDFATRLHPDGRVTVSSESYVYLAAVNCLTAFADVAPAGAPVQSDATVVPSKTDSFLVKH